MVYDQASREYALAEKVTNWCRMYVQHSTTIQLALKFTLAQYHQMVSCPRQRPLVMLLVKSCAIHGLLVTSSSVDFAMCVAGNGTIVILLLVLLCSLLVHARRILRSQSAITCLALVVPPLNTELKYNYCSLVVLSLFDTICAPSFSNRSFVVFPVYL